MLDCDIRSMTPKEMCEEGFEELQPDEAAFDQPEGESAFELPPHLLDDPDGDLGDDSMPCEKRARRRRTSLDWEEASAEHVWQRFTPTVILDSRCYARLWGTGLGGQCKKAPVSGRLLCKDHDKCSPHGLVTGAIPYRKLQEFLAAETSRNSAARRKVVASGS